MNGLSDRDRHILKLAWNRLAGAPVEFSRVVHALMDATARVIPSGRVYLLGQTPEGPLVGSLISGTAVTPFREDVLVVKVGRDGSVTRLATWDGVGALL